jgi:3-hydroxy acid dehydrogenase/malonic semialdehyde reductase
MNSGTTLKTIVITGASSGIGAATARLFAKQGWHVVLGARRTEKLKSIVSEINQTGPGKASSFPLDVTSRKSAALFCQEAITVCSGQIDILLNNAGLALGVAKVSEGSLDDWDAVIDTNVKGVLNITRSLLPHIMKQPSGHIINLGSIAGFLVYEGGSVYAASKHALRAITKTLRLELNGLPIRVTSIDPGMVETEFSNVRLKDDEKAKAVYKGLKPLSAEDIAECIYWSAARPAHVNIEEIVVMPIAQAAPHKVARSN